MSVEVLLRTGEVRRFNEVAHGKRRVRYQARYGDDGSISVVEIVETYSFGAQAWTGAEGRLVGTYAADAVVNVEPDPASGQRAGSG